MREGVRLSLFLGPVIPAPASRQVLDALASVQVDVGSGEVQSGFELTFGLSRRSPLHTLFLLTASSTVPTVRVVIAVTIAGTTEVLMDGVMTHHEVRTGDGEEPTLVVRGKDLTAVMDLVDLDGVPYPAMPPAARVLLILAKYAAFGVIPRVVPSVIEDIPLPVERIPRHQGTDYAYLTQLAREAGYVFYLDPGPAVGTSYAYWGPQIRTGTPQPALNADLDAPHRNVESLSFTFDAERKETPVVFIQEPVTKAVVGVPIPDLTPLNPPLGLVPPLPPRLTRLHDTAKLPPWVAALRGLAYAAAHADAVFGTGSLQVARYGRILRSRQLVGVRGAGEAFDGLYYVARVTHTIKRGDYRQDFTLARGSLVSTVARVPV